MHEISVYKYSVYSKHDFNGDAEYMVKYVWCEKNAGARRIDWEVSLITNGSELRWDFNNTDVATEFNLRFG